MDEIIYNGKRFIRYSAKWADSNYMIVHETLQVALNKLYISTLDFSSFGVDELVAEGDKFKQSATYDCAIAFYEKAIDLCGGELLAYILPRITSCYRHLHMAQKAIDLFSYAKNKYGEGFITPALLTSAAAAYCDLKEYQKALQCCRWAYRRLDGNHDPNLSAVFGRIKKESGLE